MRTPAYRDLLVLVALVALIRLPFLDEAVQGDDVYYLLLAENARVDPWHPMQMGFRLQGETVWAAGHTRPPGNAYLLAALLSVFGGMRETAFHAVHAGFSVLALAGMYFLAARFTARPLIAALCLAAAPPFVVNGAKLESDLPMLALLLAGAALLVHRRVLAAGFALALAAFFGYQALFLLPVFALWVWLSARRSAAAWLALGAGPAALVAWQLFERAAAGAAPAETLAGYFSSYGLLALERKWRSVQALQAHLGMLVSPLILAPALLRAARVELGFGAALALAQTLALDGYSPGERALFWLAATMGLALLIHAAKRAAAGWRDAAELPALWVVVFFAAAAAVFYAGSARYLLPLAPAVAILAAKLQSSRTWLAAGLATQMTLSLALAKSEYDYVNAYRDIATESMGTGLARRAWSNAEWGLRYYLTHELGAQPLLANQDVPAGSVVVESALAAAIPYRAGGGKRKVFEREITPGWTRLRTIGPGSRTGYSSSEFGVLPFAIAAGSIDTVTVYEIGRREPTLTYLKTSDPRADEHLLAGFFASDGAEWRWMGPEGAALLVAPQGKSVFELDFHIPEDAPARRIQVEINGVALADEHYSATGGYQLRAPYEGEEGRNVRVRIRAEPSYTPPGDSRELAVVVVGFGFVEE